VCTFMVGESFKLRVSGCVVCIVCVCVCGVWCMCVLSCVYTWIKMTKYARGSCCWNPGGGWPQDEYS